MHFQPLMLPGVCARPAATAAPRPTPLLLLLPVLLPVRRGAAQAQDAATCRSLFDQVGGLQGLTAFMPNCVPAAYNAEQCCQQVRGLGAALSAYACEGS